MRRFFLMIYLWYKDPMNIGFNILNFNFDEYEYEVDDIIKSAKKLEDINNIFNTWFWPLRCNVDENISKKIFKIIGRSYG